MPDSDPPSGPLPEEITDYYERGNEAHRLLRGTGQLERARTQEIVQRYLPPPPAVVLDVGGGSGIYAIFLAGLGYEVHLIDAVPLHIEQALRASENQPEHPIASATVGDARALDRAEDSADAVLLFGPLYHLTERSERVAALREARRVLRRGGRLLAVGISRFASALDGLRAGYLDDPAFARIVQQDLAEGQHRNPQRSPDCFTTAYLHRPRELAEEIREAGLRHETTLAIEGPGWLLPQFGVLWRNSARRRGLLDVLRTLEAEPSLLGASAHIVAIARRDG